MAEQHREYLIRREQVLAESMGKPVVLPEGSEKPVNARTLDKNEYRKVKSAFMNGMKGKR